VASLVRDFKKSCETLRGQLLAGRPIVADGQPVDAAYLDRYLPGRDGNEHTGLKGWARYYGVLTGLFRLRDKSESRARSAQKRAAVLDAIAEVPETVELVRRDAEGNARTLTVYQKSDVALRVIHGINLQLAELVDAYQLITRHGTREETDLLPAILLQQSYLQRLIVWISTSEGPGLPVREEEFGPLLNRFAEKIATPIPDAVTEIHGLDFHSLAQAFQRVNVAGFAALEAGTAPKSRPDWSVFWSGLEHELGIPAPRLMRERGLLSLIASAAEMARGREEAYARAERESKRKAG